MAVKRKDVDIVEFILPHRANTAIKNRDGFTALELAKNQECGQNILAALTRCRIQYLPQCSVNASPTDKSLYEEYTER